MPSQVQLEEVKEPKSTMMIDDTDAMVVR